MGASAARKAARAAKAPPPEAAASSSKAPWTSPDQKEWAAAANGKRTPREGKVPNQAFAKRVACTLFVGQLPYSATGDDIKAHFKRGGINGAISVRLLTRRDGGGSKGMAFVELASESDVHTALRLHHSPMDGRRINVERTVGGGKNAETRKAKLDDLRQMQGSQMKRQVEEMVKSILPEADAEAAEIGEVTKEDAEWGVRKPVCRGDVDERVLEFLQTVPTDVAESVLHEAKDIGMGGIKNRSAYLMGVLKRKVAEADKLKVEKAQQRSQNKGGGGGGGSGSGSGGGGGGATRREKKDADGDKKKNKKDRPDVDGFDVDAPRKKKVKTKAEEGGDGDDKKKKDKVEKKKRKMSEEPLPGKKKKRVSKAEDVDL